MFFSYPNVNTIMEQVNHDGERDIFTTKLQVIAQSSP